MHVGGTPKLTCLRTVPMYQTWADDSDVLKVAARVFSWSLTEALEDAGLTAIAVDIFQEDGSF